MPRPSGDADQRLLRAGRELLRERGCSALSVREVARRARVNLGLFHYHFKSRQAFMRRLLQDVYEEFFARLNLETSGGGPARDRLAKALGFLGRFARDHRPLLLLLLRGGLEGDRLTAEFVGKNVPRHAAVIAGLVAQCQREGSIQKLPPFFVLSLIFGGLNTPTLVLGLMEKAGVERPFGKPFSVLETDLLSDGAIEKRIEILLAGLTPRRRK